MNDSAAALLEALQLPATARVDRRIPKTALTEHGATRKADARLVEDGVARLDWLAELSPATVGIPPRDDPPVPAINILALEPHGVPKPRLLEIIHRAIPAPILLLALTRPARLSLAVRRLGEDGHSLVMDPLLLTPPVEGPLAAAFLSVLPGLPRLDLGLLYDGLVAAVEAWEAAAASGAPFRMSRSVREAEERRALLARFREAQTEWEAAAAAARREKRLAQRVALAEAARQKKEVLKALAGELA